MAECVFISHQSRDSNLALRVKSRVERNGLKTYLDVIDDAKLQDSLTLADHLLSVMSRCDRLIAVVSPHTKQSWWVPWEIGVGSEKRMLMASFSERYVDLPSFLKKWPALKSDYDVDTYCQATKSTVRSIRSINESTYKATETINRETRDAFLTFHKNLRGRVG